MVYLFEKRMATERVAKTKSVVSIGKGVELTFGVVPHAVSVRFRIAVDGNRKSCRQQGVTSATQRAFFPPRSLGTYSNHLSLCNY